MSAAQPIGLVKPRRFPPPWSIDEHKDACFIVKDATGHALAYVYFEEEPGRRPAAHLHPRRGPADRRQHRQAAGASAAAALFERAGVRR
jgi:hypothetical protein